MTYHTDAIYENGVLRPLTPLSLKEHEVVSLSVSTAEATESSTDDSARQRSILMSYLSKVESRPVTPPEDGLSNRDHDQLIYGQ